MKSYLILFSILIISLAYLPSVSALAPFVDSSKTPQSYVDRYENESIYRKWFDDNYGSKYDSIYEAVGLPVPKIDTSHEYVQMYKNNDYGFTMDLYNNWNVVDDESYSIELLRYSKISTGEILPQFRVGYQQVLDSSPDSFKESMESSLMMILQGGSDNNLKITKAQYKEFSGGAIVSANALSIEKIEGQKYVQKQKTALIYYDTGDLYVLNLVTDSKDYPTVAKEFIKVLENLMNVLNQISLAQMLFLNFVLIII